jgi:predicted DNA-binding transcriptional regulator AlpA
MILRAHGGFMAKHDAGGDADLSGMPFVIRAHQIPRYIGISRPTLYRMLARGGFVRKVQLGPNATGFLRDDVLSWLESRTSPTGPSKPKLD